MKVLISTLTFALLLVTSACISAADFSVKDKGYVLGEAFVINIEGEINKGDYGKFIYALNEAYSRADVAFKNRVIKLKENNQYAPWMAENRNPSGMATIEVHLNSNGGDVSDAIKIGKVIRVLLLKTVVGGFSKWKDPQCLSSCFFIWVSGVEREFTAFGRPIYLGIHRLYFKPDDFKRLSPKEAEKEYKNLISLTRNFLKDMDVPSFYTDKIFNTASNKMYVLAENEIDAIEGTVPFMEELLIAQCGSYTYDEKSEYLDCGLVDGFKRSRRCKVTSSGYLVYLKQKIENTDECTFNKLGIARWNRAVEHLFNGGG